MRRKSKRATFLLVLSVFVLSSWVYWTGAAEPTPSVNAMPENYAPASSARVIVPVSQTEDIGTLALVNREYKIKSEPEISALVSAWPSAAVSTTEIMLRGTALDGVAAMLDAASQAGFDSLYITSGFRGYEEQAGLYENATDKNYVQPPNHSEHQLGLAADIFGGNLTKSAMADTEEGRWLTENCWRYGLIQRYAGDKSGITLIAEEPWHFRYVGIPHAWYCRENNLCLEEYIAFLKGGGEYSVTIEGATYSVYYSQPNDGTVQVPQGEDYEISSDNTGGYIITVKA